MIDFFVCGGRLFLARQEGSKIPSLEELIEQEIELEIIRGPQRKVEMTIGSRIVFPALSRSRSRVNVPSHNLEVFVAAAQDSQTPVVVGRLRQGRK